MATGFIDKARITVRAGNGGNGAVAFHRENTTASTMYFTAQSPRCLASVRPTLS